MSKALIIIPTYNEKENIEELVAEIFRYADGVNILIVDDNSSDGTGIIADKIALADSRVSVLHREAYKGRGCAGIDGYKEAIKREGVQFIMEMDADFSHQPECIPCFLKEIKDNDVVIGSRFIEGGDAKRGVFRKIFSKLANFFVRHYLSLNIKDCTSGYRCFRREVILSLNLDTLVSKGPAIIEEVLCILHNKRYKIKEIPIIFKKRHKGKTKLSILKSIKVFLNILQFKRIYLGNHNKNEEIRKQGFYMALALNIIGSIIFYRGKEHFIWFIIAGSLNLIIAMMCPVILMPVKKTLDTLILLINYIFSVLSFAIIFYLIFMPIGILMRLFGKDLLDKRIDRESDSYWIRRKDKIFSAKAYERMG